MNKMFCGFGEFNGRLTARNYLELVERLGFEIGYKGSFRSMHMFDTDTFRFGSPMCTDY